MIHSTYMQSSTRPQQESTCLTPSPYRSEALRDALRSGTEAERVSSRSGRLLSSAGVDESTGTACMYR